MRCIYCNTKHEQSALGGLIYINCCEKTQILRSSVRERVRKSFQEDDHVILVDQIPDIVSFLLRTKVL